MNELDIRHVNVESPEREKKDVLGFWSGDYLWATESRLRRPWGKERFGFVAAFLGEQCVGTTSYAISPRGHAILSQVFTDPDHRGCGIATKTLQGVLKIFREEGARAVYLGAWEEWIRNIYRKVGFQLVGMMGERHAFKLTLQPSGEDAVLFRRRQKTRLRAIREDDQCDLSSLFNAPHPVAVKHREFGCYEGSHFEGEFFALLQARERRGFKAVVLDGEETVLGMATIIPSSRRHQEHTGVLDLVVHSQYWDQAGAVLGELEADCPLEKLIAYVAAGDQHRRQFFEASGFRSVATLRGELKISGKAYDLARLEKNL